mmetsp:Transcript_30863/g.49550  ORF Transcript_30863/g.49550 Transcript_30863/m.49550 type:complete len:298 (-) Transcript_30863:214-1107(-)
MLVLVQVVHQQGPVENFSVELLEVFPPLFLLFLKRSLPGISLLLQGTCGRRHVLKLEERLAVAKLFHDGLLLVVVLPGHPRHVPPALFQLSGLDCHVVWLLHPLLIREGGLLLRLPDASLHRVLDAVPLLLFHLLQLLQTFGDCNGLAFLEGQAAGAPLAKCRPEERFLLHLLDFLPAVLFVGLQLDLPLALGLRQGVLCGADVRELEKRLPGAHLLQKRLPLHPVLAIRRRHLLLEFVQLLRLARLVVRRRRPQQLHQWRKQLLLLVPALHGLLDALPLGLLRLLHNHLLILNGEL